MPNLREEIAEILNDSCELSHLSGANERHKEVSDQILSLIRQRLPKKKKVEIYDADYEGFNLAIDQMREELE